MTLFAVSRHSCIDVNHGRQSTASGQLQYYLIMAAGLNGGVRRFIVRTGLAISCLVTARFVPFLALLMALIGSFLTINVSLIFPVGSTLHACSIQCIESCQVCTLACSSTLQLSQSP